MAEHYGSSGELVTETCFGMGAPTLLRTQSPQTWFRRLAPHPTSQAPTHQLTHCAIATATTARRRASTLRVASIPRARAAWLKPLCIASTIPPKPLLAETQTPARAPRAMPTPTMGPRTRGVGPTKHAPPSRTPRNIAYPLHRKTPACMARLAHELATAHTLQAWPRPRLPPQTSTRTTGAAHDAANRHARSHNNTLSANGAPIHSPCRPTTHALRPSDTPRDEEIARACAATTRAPNAQR